MADAPRIDLGAELGSGTSGSVRHGVLTEPFGPFPEGTQVAVKTAHGRGPEQAALEREARALRAVGDAPCLPRLVHAGERLVTLYLPGPSLRELIDGGPLFEVRARRLGGDLARALTALHAAGWWHGDVKPENVRLDGDQTAVLLDLGFARPIGTRGPQAGSLPYLSPEQCAGGPGSPAADVFSLGVILAEMVTGELPCAPPPERRGEVDAWLEARREAETFLASRINPRVSPLFDCLVSEALAREVDRRPSAADLAARLDAGERGEWWRQVIERRRLWTSDPRAVLEAGRLPFVGRSEELATLSDAFLETASSGGRAVWLEGPEGCGRSRLVTEFVARARHTEQPPVYLHGRCSEFPDQRPGQPLRSLLRHWLRLAPRAPIGERELALLAEEVPGVLLDGIARALDPAAEETTAGEGAILAEALARIGGKHPVVVFLDDVTFADAVTLDGLTRLADHLGETHILLILGSPWGHPARHPTQIEKLRAHLATHTPVIGMLLKPLSEEDVLELVQALFHPSTPSLRLARTLHERSEGVPGMLAELLRTLEQRGLIRRRHGGRGTYELLAPVAAIPEPGSQARQFSARLDRVDPDLRRRLPLLAALGGMLEPHLLAAVFEDLDRDGAQALLERLQSDGWLVLEEGRFRFTRPGLRERLYQLLSEPEREAIHAAAARVLSKEEGRDREYQWAYHLHAAGHDEELLALALPLIRRLRTRGHPGRISALTAWALEALDRLDPGHGRDVERMELLEAAASAADSLGRPADERRALDRLADLNLDSTREPEAVGRIYLLLGRHAARSGRYDTARGMLRNAAHLLRLAHATELKAEALLTLASMQEHVGRLEEARRLARRARGLSKDEVRQARCNLVLAATALIDDAFDEALRRIDRAVARLRRQGETGQSRAALARASLLRARTYRLLGRPRRAYGALQRALRLATRAGERRLEVEAAARHGRLLLDLDRVDTAKLVLREALTSAQEIEHYRGQVLATLFLGTLLAEDGDPEATLLLQRGQELARTAGLERLEALGLAILARLERQAGRARQALELARSARDRFHHRGGELADRIVIEATLILLLNEAGRSASARELEQSLRRRIRRVNERISAPIMRQRHHRASASLLRTALSPEGPIYPRAARDDLPGRREG